MTTTKIHRAPLPPGQEYACDESGCVALASCCWRVVEQDNQPGDTWEGWRTVGAIRITCAAHAPPKRKRAS